MKINREGDKLIISETPGCLWVFGLMFVFIGGMFVYGALGGFTNSDMQSIFVLAFALIAGAVGVGAGIWTISKAPITKVAIDRANRIVIWTTFGFMGRETLVYKFDDVERFCLIEDRDSEGAEIWWFGMELINGEVMRIGAIASHFEENERRFVFAANEFADKQPSVFELIESADELEQ